MSSSGFFGPALPPDYGIQSSSRDSDSDNNQSAAKRKSQRHSSKSSASDQSEDENISSPKKLRTDSYSAPIVMGPALPPGFLSHSSIESNSETFIGPIIPSSAIVETALRSNVEDDHDLVGPVLPGNDAARNSMSVIDELEARALHMKNKLLGVASPDRTPVVASRDTWMTELPPELVKNFGVTARKFSTKAPTSGNKDRSGWTDTPADRARKEQQALDGTLVPEPPKVSKEIDDFLLEVDASYRTEVDEYNKLARPKSLLEIHNDKLQGKSDHHSKKKKKKDKKESKDKKQKKKKKKRSRSSDEESEKKETKKVERKPFDREKDLELSRMDDSKRKAVIKRSHELGTRFGHGSLQFL